MDPFPDEGALFGSAMIRSFFLCLVSVYEGGLRLQQKWFDTFELLLISLPGTSSEGSELAHRLKSPRDSQQ